MSDSYDGVDNSKKKRVKATLRNTQKPATSSLYATLDVSTSSRRAPDEVNDSPYDLLGTENLYCNTVHSANAAEVPQEIAISQEPSAARLHYNKLDKDRNEGKPPLCMLTCLVILAVAVIAVFAAVVIAFILIATLKSDMESLGCSESSSVGSLEFRYNQLNNKIKNFIGTSRMMLKELSENTFNRVNSLEGDIIYHSELTIDLPRILNNTIEQFSALQNQLSIKINDLSANVTNEEKIISDRADQVIRMTEGIVNSSAIELATDIRALYVFESCDIVRGLRFPFPSGTYRIGPSQGNYSLKGCSTSTALTCNGISGQWRRVAYLDTNQTNYECPGSLQANTSSCRIFESSPTCSSVFFSSGGLLILKFVVEYMEDTLGLLMHLILSLV